MLDISFAFRLLIGASCILNSIYTAIFSFNGVSKIQIYVFHVILIP